MTEQQLRIESARLHEHIERREQLLVALDEASRYLRPEKGPSKLLQEIVRLATQLVGCVSGGLYTNRPYLQELELSVVYGLPPELIGSRQLHSEGLIGHVVRTGQPTIVPNYVDWPDREAIFESQNFKVIVAIPLKQAGGVEAVLFVADSMDSCQLGNVDLEILERFTIHASLAIQTSRLMNREHGIFSQLAILHKISNYIQVSGDLDKTLHVVLTGVTAGYGLGFNRAALLLLDGRREHLVGRMGIGYLEESEAMQDWELHHRRGLEDFGRYLELLEEDDLHLTPISEKVRRLRLPVKWEAPDILSRAVVEQQCIIPKANDLEELPDSFVEAFQPALPLVIAPLQTRSQVIGLLVADNKFNESPITNEDVERLLTFANTAAIAIDNQQLLHETIAAQERLRSFYRASNALVSSQDPDHMLRDIVEQARVAAGACTVNMILIDKSDQVRELIMTNPDNQPDKTDMIQSDAISMEVMRTGIPAVIEDTVNQRELVNLSMCDRHVAAALCLPISLEGNRIGVMWMHYDQPRHFSAAEHDAAQLFVNQAALAYDSARRIRALEHMRQAAEALAGVVGLEAVLEQIGRSAQQVFQADSATIWSYDAVRNDFISESATAVGIPQEVWEEFRKEEPQQDGIAHTILEWGWVNVQNVDDMKQYPFLNQSTRQLLRRIKVQSFQGIRLTVGDETLGVLYVNYTRPRSFNKEDQEAAQTFANRAALALKTAKLLDQLNKVHNAARLVAKVTVLDEDLQRTLLSVVQGTQDVLQCDVVTLYVYDESKDKLHYPPIMTEVLHPERVTSFSAGLADSIVLDMLRRSDPYIVDNIAMDPLFKDCRFAQEEQITSCVAIPLKVGPEKVGVIFVNYRSPHHFTPDELENIVLLANQAAVAIRNTHLYQERKRRVNLLHELHRAGQAVTGSLTIEETLEQIVKQAVLLVGGHDVEGCFGHLALVDNIVWRFTATYPQDELPNLQAKLGDIDLEHSERIGITGRAITTGESQMVNDLLSDPDYLLYDPAIQSVLAVPIKHGGQSIGAINMASPTPAAFSIEDQWVLEALAGYAAIAIQNARLYAEVRNQLNELEKTLNELEKTKSALAGRTAVAWMGMISSSWRHTIEGHAITIKEEIDSLRQALPKEALIERNQKKLAKIKRLAQAIHEKPITPPLSSEEGVTSVPVNDLLQERLTQLWKNEPYKSAEYEFNPIIDNSTVVRISSEWLRRLFDILIDNAIEALSQSAVKSKRVTVTTRLISRWVTISVADTGRGIPEAVRPILFQRQVPKSKGDKGLGIGLLMAQLITQTYAGEIEIESTGPIGTTIVVRLPLEL